MENKSAENQEVEKLESSTNFWWLTCGGLPLVWLMLSQNRHTDAGLRRIVLGIMAWLFLVYCVLMARIYRRVPEANRHEARVKIVIFGVGFIALALFLFEAIFH